MPAGELVWLIDHFCRFNGGSDPVLTNRYLRSLWHEADRRGLEAVDLLMLIEEHADRAIGDVPAAVPLRAFDCMA